MEQSADEGVIIALLIPLVLLATFSLVNGAVIAYAAFRSFRASVSGITAVIIASATSLVTNAIGFYFLILDPRSSFDRQQVIQDQQAAPIFNAVHILVFGWTHVALGALSTISLMRAHVTSEKDMRSGTRFTIVVIFLAAHMTAILSVMVALLA